MRKKWLIVALFVSILLIVNLFLSLDYKVKPIDEINVTLCVTDNDCVKVQTTCCPCSMGGKEKCIASSEKENYQNVLKECSENLICPAIYGCQIESCSCLEGVCVGV
jgi:hypothetical protein